MMPELDQATVKKAAAELTKRDNCDVFLYNGDIQRNVDLDFILQISGNRKHDNCRLILVTNGGDPDAAFKISRYLQDRYKKFDLLISGLCKSAGTLIAIGANELAFTPYGELGPLDVQVFKEDKISAMHSGLNISEAMAAMEKASINTYLKLISNMFRSSGGVVSFATASKCASDMISAMYAPVFAQFDPEDLGGRTRSMRIAADYGKRLDNFSHNMKAGAIQKLAETYSSHSFVIDKLEANALFKNVRDADALELELVGALGNCSRWPLPSVRNEPLIHCLSAQEDDKDGKRPEESVGKGPAGSDRASPRRASKSSISKSSRAAGNGGGAVPAAVRPAKPAAD